MRSSNAKPSKSVSICNESYPNGPCAKKEGAEAETRADDGCTGLETESNDAGEDEIAEDRVRNIASKVVEDVVRLASKTANERRAEAQDEAIASTSWTEPTVTAVVETHQSTQTIPGNESTTSSSKAEKIKRLPTIQIDTVPSLPSSPTEWQSPLRKDVIAEEDEDILDEEEINIDFSSTDQNSKVAAGVQEFATSYINDIIEKAMALAEEKQKSKDTEAAKEIATKVVEDILTQANDKAFEKLKADLTFPDPVPFIQIDTVPSMPPSPTLDEEEEQKQNDAQQSRVVKRKKAQFVYREEDEIVVPPKAQPPPVRNLIKHSEAPTEIREFASSYVKDIISKAITMAEEKLVSSVPFNFEDVDLMKTSGPWYIRAREALMNILRAACFCTPRRDDS